MNLRQLLETASIVAAHGPSLIESHQRLPPVAIEAYAACSLARIDAWLAALDDVPQRLIQVAPDRRPEVWDRAQVLLTDVLAGDLIARVWGALLTAADRFRRIVSAEAAARHVLDRQEVVRQRALELLVEGTFLTLDRAIELDRIRRRMERWTDLMLGYPVRKFALQGFACNLERALEFGEELLGERFGPRHDRAWALYRVCLSCAFPDAALPQGRFADWREEIVRSILSCLPAELFHREGPLKSVRIHRLLNSAALPEAGPRPGRLPGVRRRQPD